MSIDSLTTALGGVTIDLIMRDGTREAVLVRQLPVSELAAYGIVLNDEPRAIELFCKKPDGWAECISMKSAEEIITTGEELNLSFFSRLHARAVKRMNLLTEGVDQRVIDAVSRAAVNSSSVLGNTSSPQASS